MHVHSDKPTVASRSAPTEYSGHLRARGFELEEQIGWGLSGAVYKATQASLSRSVAVKFCDSIHMRKNEALRKRFEREAKLLARVAHPAIPYVILTGVVPTMDVPYTVLEYINGRRLRDELAVRKTFDHDFALQLTIELLEALSAAHKAKIVHRDVSPENIMVSFGKCMLIDFSIGFHLDGAPGVTRATGSGEHLGRVDYMAPEQTQNMGTVDDRCDVYSAAVVLLEMLTGSPKFAPAQLDAQLGHLSADFRNVLKMGLAQDRDARFKSALEFRNALKPFGLGAATSLSTSATAICASLTCPNANWTSRGYYSGPAIYRECTDAFCKGCGGPLKRACEKCSRQYADGQYCGNCGTGWYEIPTCETCGSWLLRQDMGSDTKAICCTKGRRGRPPPQLTVIADDDIPF